MIELPEPDPNRDRCAEARERPLLRPWIIAEPIPTLAYAGADGRFVALALDDRGLAALALSIAEAQALRARRTLAILQTRDL